MTPKNVALVGAACVTIGWLLASVLTPPVGRVQGLPPQRVQTPPPRVPDPTFTTRLQTRLDEHRPAPTGRRNPFAFATRERASASAVDTGTAASVSQDTAPPETPAGPAVSLSGIGISGDTRTAVLATLTGVLIVAVGDRVGDYTVSDISTDSVTLTLGDETVTLRFPQ